MAAVLDIAAKFLFVVVFFSLCIFVHELGHLLVALWRGLRAERFAIGFGKKLWSRTYKGVEYSIRILPFGGFVALPQLEPSDQPTDSEGNPLPIASPGSRALTALAGPVANLIFGFFLGCFIWWFGVYEDAPANSCDVIAVRQVLPLYRDGLRESDRVVAVDGVQVSGTWEEITEGLPVPEGPLRLTVERDGAEEVLEYSPEPNPEYAAGLRPGDRIVAVDGKGFRKGAYQMSMMIALNTDDLTLTVERDGKRRDITYEPVKNPVNEGLWAPFFRVRQPVGIAGVVPGSPAARAGLKKGDALIRVDGTLVEDQGHFIDTIRESAGRELVLTVERDGTEVAIGGLRAAAADVNGETVYRIGAELDEPQVLAYPNPWQQFVDVFDQTRQTLGSLFAPVVGKKSSVRPKHMSGPVGIINVILLKVKYAGYRGGLSFIILVCFSLAFFNLLPIPVLDGGHIMYSFAEFVIRRRLPVRLVHILQNVFAGLLISFMLYVTFFDLLRAPRFWRLIFGSRTEAPAQPNGSPVPEPPDPSGD